MAGYDTYLLSVNPNAGNPLGEEKGLMAEYDTYLLTINPNTGNPLGEEQRLDDRIRHLCANIFS